MLTSQVLGDSRGCLYEGDLAPLDALVIMPSMMSGPLASDEVKVGMRESQIFDHLVGGGDQSVGEFEAKRPCRPEIDCQLEASLLKIRYVGRIGSMQNLNDNQIFSLDAAKSLQFIKESMIAGVPADPHICDLLGRANQLDALYDSGLGAGLRVAGRSRAKRCGGRCPRARSWERAWHEWDTQGFPYASR